MRRKILALSLVLAMAASVLSPAAMAQTVSDSLPIVSVTSESTAESTSAAESVSTAESTSTAESVSTPASAPAAESTSDAVASENTTAAQPQADEVAIDETNFPDANFREFVKQYDTDGNGSFSQNELDAVTEINASSKAIQSLKGIEYFTALESLDVRSNQLTSLDVSANTALTSLNVSYNQLSELDVSANTALTSLDVRGGNQLTSLDVSANTALESLNVWANQLTSLDVSRNTALTELNVSYNQLTSLDVSANTALGILDVSGNQLTSLDVSKNTALTELYVNGSKQLTSLDVSDHTALKKLNAYDSQLTSLDVSGCTALTSLNVQPLYDGEHDGDGKLALLDVSDCTALESLYVSGNQLTSLDVSDCTGLIALSVGANQLTSLDVSDCTGLISLFVSANQLTSLDVSANTELVSLDVGSNQLTSLDVSANTALGILDVSDNQLTSLDVSANTALKGLEVQGCNLTSLDVSANTELQSLEVGSNQLTSLDVSANTALGRLNVSDNQLISLKLGNKPSWEYIVDNPTQLSLTAKAGTAIDLKTYAPFFDASKVSNVQGGTIDANGILTGWTSGSPVTYTYDAGFEQVLNVEITIQDEAQTTEVAIDETNFPDANFREFVKQYDTDGNGSFSQAELDAVTEISVGDKGIQSLKGVEYFTKLTDLYVSGNKLTELDVSKNTLLTKLNASGNQLKFLDLGANTALVSLDVNNNQLTSLDLNKNVELESLDTCDNKLQHLDLTSNKNLIRLNAHTNQLTSIDLTSNTALERVWLHHNRLVSLDISTNKKISTLDVNTNYLKNLNVSQNEQLGHLNVSDNNLVALDISNNTKLWFVAATNNDLLTLETSQAQLDEFLIDNPSTVSLSVSEGMSISLKLYAPGFDPSKVSNVKGGTIDANGVLTGWTNGIAVTYTYDAGFDKQLNVKLNITGTSNGLIELPAPTSPVEGTTGRLLMEKTFTNVPESLKAVGLDSVEKVTDKLLASVTGTTKDNTVVYDVHYSISADGQTWNALTPEQFPKEGLTITLPYPEGVDTKANDFTAMHMFTQDVNGFKTGDVEVIKAVKTDAGLQMTVKGFSPIAITWAKAGTTPPTDGGNGGNVVTPPTGGNGTATQPTTPNPGTGAIAQTGDNSAVAVWGIVMALCATAAAGLMIMKSKGKKKQ